MSLPKALPCLLLLLLSGGGVAQKCSNKTKAEVKVDDVSVGNVFIKVTPVRPQPQQRAEIETYAECLLTPSGEPEAYQQAALAATVRYSHTDIGSLPIRLAHALDKDGKVCVIERFYAADDQEGSYEQDRCVSKQKVAESARTDLKQAIPPPTAPYPPPAPYIEDVYIDDGAIAVMPVQPLDHERAQIETYRVCNPNVAGGAAKDQHLAIAGTQEIDNRNLGPIVLQLEDKMAEKGTVCVIEYIYSEEDTKREHPLRTLVSELQTAKQHRIDVHKARFPSKRSARTFARVTTGIDVSAAASADPAAHFMADLSFDAPFSNHNSSLYKLFSANGYLRLASIAQPGKINGIATPATYIHPLTDSTPNSLVQSWEGDVAFAMRATPRLNLGEQDAYWTISGIVDGGFITPISADQTTTPPVVYIANKAIYDFYTKTPIVNAPAAKAISDACVISASAPFPTCYVSYVTQDRTRFFRNYAVGVTFKRYRYQGADNVGKPYQGDDKFDFPGTATIKIGQNEYVTKGQARGLVLHGDFFWPIHSVLKGNWTGPLYVFGQIDEHLSGNESSQQFILATPASTVQRTDPNVAIIPVQQPDRDRYRFGVAVDLGTLLKAITPGRD